MERVELRTGRVERVEREERPVEHGDGGRVRAVGTSQRVNGLVLGFLPESNCDCVKVETGRCSLLVTPVTVAEDPHLQEVLSTTGGSATRERVAEPRGVVSFHCVAVVTVRPRLAVWAVDGV